VPMPDPVPPPNEWQTWKPVYKSKWDSIIPIQAVFQHANVKGSLGLLRFKGYRCDWRC
jgi:hypothetical protein